ncbi:MAG TPA: polyprenyl synthetase family protein [Clostridia bacterium]|nr:polyprenyl synthetase family protein [Clostridia bacterium]
MTENKFDIPHEAGLTYDSAVDKTNKEMQSLLRGAPMVIRSMTSHLSKAAGKQIRARILLACALREDETVDPNAIKAAAAAELLHLATLVHDDIIDDADKRRGIDTVHRKFGQKYAVLCGDYLFCTALELVSSVTEKEDRKIDRAFPHYLTEVLLGELRQNANDFNFSLSEREYFMTIRGKTAALFEACFYIGFLLSDELDSAKDIYKRVGNDLGIIFQLNDDCADYASTQEKSKKPVLSDYLRGVITLPLIYALKHDSSLRARAQAGMPASELKLAVIKAGGLTYTQSKIDTLYKRAAKAINGIKGDAKREILMGLLMKAAGSQK